MTLSVRMIRIVFALMFMVSGSLAHASADEAWRAYSEKDYARAVQLAQTPAQEGNKDAQYLLGLAAKHGRGAEQSHEAAVKWFTLAAERGHADALNDLGTTYSRGEGVARDDAKAFGYFRMAAERGSAAAQRNVGQMYEKGVGTPKDNLKALYWYEQTDATLYRRELREKTKDRLASNTPAPNKLPPECKPSAPPTREMNKARIDLLSGSIEVYLDERSRPRGVTVTDLNSEDFRYIVVALFSKSLRAEQCRFADGLMQQHIRIPFRFVLTK